MRWQLRTVDQRNRLLSGIHFRCIQILSDKFCDKREHKHTHTQVAVMACGCCVTSDEGRVAPETATLVSVYTYVCISNYHNHLIIITRSIKDGQPRYIYVLHNPHISRRMPSTLAMMRSHDHALAPISFFSFSSPFS